MPTLLEKKFLKKKGIDLSDEIPVDYLVKWLIARIPSRTHNTIEIEPKHPGDKVMILKAKTASGKSTVLPPHLWLKMKDPNPDPDRQKKIAILEPRVLNTISVPNDILEWNKVTMGDDIGYQTGVRSRHNRRGLTFMTNGILMMQLSTMTDSEFMSKYSVVMIDECHERSVQLDVVMYLLKKLLERNWKKPSCPFIIAMSATFDEKKFMNYFNTEHYFLVEGATYDIQEHFLDYPSSNFYKSAVDICIDIHTNSNDIDDYVKDVLIFISGARDVREFKKMFDQIQKDKKMDFLVLSLMGADVASGKSDQVFDDKIKKRRIILGSNAVETGVTIHTIKYVIDPGFQNLMVYEPNLCIKTLITSPVTRGSAMQRRGRCGRNALGVWYPLYDKETFDFLDIDPHPDIFKEDISLDILNLLNIGAQNIDVEGGHIHWGIGEQPNKIGGNTLKIGSGKFDIMTADLMDLPPSDSLSSAFKKLYIHGAIDTNMDITEAGVMMNKMGKMTIEEIKMTMSAYAWGASITDIASIIGLMNEDIFIYNKSNKDNFIPKKFRQQVADDLIENLYLAHLIEINIRKSNFRGWCYDNNLKYKSILDYLEARDNVLYSVAKAGLDVSFGTSMIVTSPGAEEIKTLKHCIYEGYKLFMLKKKDNTFTYKGIEIEIMSNIIPKKIMNVTPNYVLAPNIILMPNRMKGKYMLKVTNISIMDGFVSPDPTLFC